MTRSFIELPITADDRRIAGYASAAIALSIAEAAIPSPVPGIKPGLANIIILLVLLRYGWTDAAWVSLLRVAAGALALGQLFTPGFFFSLGGALCSLTVLALSIRLPARWFGPVSHSLLAAFAHIGGQLLIARLWLMPNDGVLYLAPFFALAAIVFGVINGLAAAWLLAREASVDDVIARTDAFTTARANTTAVLPAPTCESRP
jgi:heptaprenyl diphosphate synthase